MAEAAAAVLLIEPDGPVAQVITDALRDEGYAVEWMAALCDALTRLAAGGPDAWCLVLSDAFALPPAGPYTWLDQLRARTTAPIVIMTTLPDALFADHRARGFAAVLPKPFELDQLRAVVAAVCHPPAGEATGAGM